ATVSGTAATRVSPSAVSFGIAAFTTDLHLQPSPTVAPCGARVLIGDKKCTLDHVQTAISHPGPSPRV
ncbi:hypothetical protein, partial [Ferrimicrobium sp.]|uniref:hypothetical protein n=1 Tax=Ferrimicrobium sp. TaxID=2926050 RepID=UPI0026271D86